MTWTVALTGGIGCGKSLVAHYFSDLGVPIFDADTIAKTVAAPGTPLFDKIIEHFGTTYRTAEGTLDRKNLGTYIFAHPHERQWLEQQIHPIIHKTLCEQIATCKAAYAIAVIPLFFESKNTYPIQRVLVIDCPEALQRARTKARDGKTDAEVQNILDNQASRATRLSRADDVILNEQDAESLKNTVLTLHQQYLALAHRASNFS